MTQEEFDDFLAKYTGTSQFLYMHNDNSYEIWEICYACFQCFDLGEV